MHSAGVLLLAFLAITNSALGSPLPQSSSGSSGYFPSVKEIGWCIVPWHWSTCNKADGHADVAGAAAESLFPGPGLHNGKGDAFRHCYWNARMTIDLGSDNAKAIGDNHEDGSDGPEAEKKMDRANNASGRSIGAAPGASYASAKEACRVAAANGALVTL